MQVVIDINENLYTRLFDNGGVDTVDMLTACDTIRKGTVLPKGHGRLGDLDNVWSELKELEEHYQTEFLKESNAIHESAMNGRLYGFTNSKFIVQDAPTIIEADKETDDYYKERCARRILNHRSKIRRTKNEDNN